MSDIPPFAGPLPSPREDPEEHRRFENAMLKPLEVLDAMAKGHDLQLREPYRFQVAKLCAGVNARTTAARIRSFVLNEADKFQVLQVCIQKDPSLLLNIKEFNLSEEHLSELIKFFIKGGGADKEFLISNLLQNSVLPTAQCLEMITLHLFPQFLEVENAFQLHATAEQRCGVAKFYVEHDMDYVLEDIRIFNLEDDDRFEVVKFCAEENMFTTVENINKFHLTAEHRLELAKFCLQEDPSHISKILDTFDLPDDLPDDLAIEFYMLAGRCDPEIYSATLEEIVKILVDVVRKGDVVTSMALLSQLGWIEESGWAALIKGLGPQEQVVLISRALNTVSSFYKGDITEEQVNWLCKEGFLAKILESRPSLGPSLIDLAKEAANDPLLFDNLSKAFPPLLCLPLAKLVTQGVDIDSLDLNKKDLKDTKKLVPLLLSMIQLADNEVLSPEEKTRIIRAMSSETRKLREEAEGVRNKAELKQSQERIRASMSNTLSSARDLWTILLCGRSDLLQGNNVRNANDLKNLAFEAFSSILPLPGAVEDFSTRFQETFGAYRQPNALQIYAAGLNRDKGPSYRRALRSLGDHVFSVLTGTYQTKRYDPTKNPHLKRLNAHDPKLLGVWQKNSEEKLALFPGFSIHETDDPEDLLLCGTETPSCQSVDFDPSYNRGLVGYLRNGQTRLLEVKDKDGRIVARRLLRLLWDEEGKTPVLFLEKLYSTVHNPEFDNALIEMAKQKADLLKCPLTSLYLTQEYEDYPHSLESLGGLAPCEFIDGAGGLREKSDYTIHLAKLWYNPLNAAAVA